MRRLIVLFALLTFAGITALNANNHSIEAHSIITTSDTTDSSSVPTDTTTLPRDTSSSPAPNSDTTRVK